MSDIGIIGFGRIGAEHAGWIARAGLGVAAVFDPTPARREIARQRGLRTVDSLDVLLREDSVAAVLVATPTSMHHEHAMAALQSGKHVLVEKPMALDLSQARALVEEAERRGRVLSVFHNRRWDVDFLTAMTLRRSGTLGRVFNVESRLGQFASCVGPAAPQWRPGWRNEASFGGGGLYDWGSHFLDQLWRLFHPDRPLRVFAQLRGNVWSHDCDDLARVLIEFESAAIGLVEINTTTTRPLPRWQIDGTLGSASSPFSLAFDTQTWARFEFTPADGSPTRQVTPASPGLSEPDLWRRFADACGGNGRPAVTARSVLPTMALLDAARTSSRETRVVDLDPSLFTLDATDTD
jgi:predicted dehydrogenase